MQNTSFRFCKENVNAFLLTRQGVFPAKAGIILSSRPRPNWSMPYWKAVTPFLNATSFKKLLLHLSCFLSSASRFRQTWRFCLSHLKLDLLERDSTFRSHSSSQAHTEVPGTETFNPWLITKAKIPLKKSPWLKGPSASTVLQESENHCACNRKLTDLALKAFPQKEIWYFSGNCNQVGYF